MRLQLSIPIDDSASDFAVKRLIQGAAADAADWVFANRAAVEETKPGDIPLGIEVAEVETTLDGNVGARLTREDCTIPF